VERSDRLNRTRYWHDRHTSGLSLMHADLRTQQYAPHRHDGFVIAVTELGGSVIRSRGVVGETHARVLSAFNPLEAHSGGMGTSRHWRFRSLYLEAEAIDDVCRSLGVDDMPYLAQNLLPDDDLVVGFLALHRALAAGRDALRERELLVMTFGALFSRHSDGGRPIEPGPRDRRRLRAAEEMMRAELAGQPRLGALSAALGLTEYQLTSLFKRTTGLTPHTYLTQLRLDEARRGLSQGAPIAETASRCGFYDQSALTNHFKRRYGMTPLQFVAATRASR
jgi:AraC-like DNA-binding protein